MPKGMCKDKDFLTLSIETSCDETAASVVSNGRMILSDVISTQIDTHKLYGGVVPEIASRQHLMNINGVIAKALEDANVEFPAIDLIAVTYGPGLIGALVIGVAAAKALALAGNIPLVGVNHMHGHISSNYISYPELKPPFVSLVISGGHTNLINVKDYTNFEVIGRTRDDAVGEAYDKVARVIGLGYPGGPKIDKIAKEGDADAIHFKRVYLDKDSLDFSFSGIKTAVLNYVNTEKQARRELNINNIAAGFQEAIVDVLVDKSIQAVKQYGDGRLVLAGGVAANSRIREAIAKRCEEEGIKLYLPEKELCTDNAAMIACAGYYKYLKNGEDSLRLDAIANLTF